jgi:predicted protein tyrosine phosphatase
MAPPPEGEDEARIISMPVQLLPWLYLSRLPEVLDYNTLQQMGITAVLTCNKIFRQEQFWDMTAAYAERDILHGYVGGVDIVGYNMMKYHWNDVQQFIHQARSSQANPETVKIIIHCAAGTNRSALMAGAVMLTFDTDQEWTFLEVIHHLKAKRGRVLNNVWFIQLLAEFAQQHDKLGPRPPGYTNEPLRNSEMII